MLITFNYSRFESNIDIICYAQFLKDFSLALRNDSAYSPSIMIMLSHFER